MEQNGRGGKGRERKEKEGKGGKQEVLKENKAAHGS